MAQTIQNNQILNDGVPIASTLLPDTPQPPIVQSSRTAQIEGAKYGSDLASALAKYNVQGTNTSKEKDITVDTYSDGYTQMLDKVAQSSGNATKALIASIKAKKYQNDSAVEGNYENYKKGLQLLGIQHNQAQFTPDLLGGQILSVQNEKQQKLEQLDAEEAKALMDAEDAQAKNDLSTLKSKMEYVKQIKEEKKNAIKDLYEKMAYEQKIGDIQAGQIYDQLKQLKPADQEAFLSQISQQLNIPVGALVKSIADIKESTIKKATGSGGEYTPVELRKLRQAGINPQDIAEADDYLYGDEENTTKFSKTDFDTGISTVIANGGTFDDGVPYMTQDKKITTAGFTRLVNAGAKAGVSKTEVIKKLKPYINSRNKALKEYGISKSEADEAGL